MAWAGAGVAVIVLAACVLAMAEDGVRLPKSTSMLVSAGLSWLLAGAALEGAAVRDGFRHTLLDYAELLLFVVVAMVFVRVLEERQVFAVLRARLMRAHLGYRGLFWATGGGAFCLSPLVDNLTAALLMGTVAASAGRHSPPFVSLCCVNIVVAANAGGVASPFGDVTTLMVWQKGAVAFPDFVDLILPSIVAWLVPALLMVRAVPPGLPANGDPAVAVKPGAAGVALLFGATIVLAVAGHAALHLPPVAGMMAGLGALLVLARLRGEDGPDVLGRMAELDWDTLLFFYGMTMSVGALALFGHLAWLSDALYLGIGPGPANVAVGVLSAVLDNIPLTYAVLTMRPEMSPDQWLLLTLAAGIGGSLLPIGSAAGVALMGQARGAYSFAGHLRWTPAIAAGYAAAIATHLLVNMA